MEHTSDVNTMTLRIAVYGKGGIGKSTVSANVSYCLSAAGLKVMQIGCDPKHDSTRPLTYGPCPTVLDTVRSTRPSERRPEMFVSEGVNGILCVEAGGPEPGIGCAGKGIMTMFHTLETLGIDRMDRDVCVYDVLGDVVCGGFAVPMRRDMSDMVVLVTSGEFMSIYAANNIMRGLVNFDTDGPRLAGLVFDSRGSPEEDAVVKRFSESTGVPVIARIPRSGLFRDSEKVGRTLCEVFPSSDEAGIFRTLSKDLLDIHNGGRMCRPHPLTDAQVDLLMSGKDVGTGEYTIERPQTSVPKNVFIPPLRIGRGPMGAAIEAGRVTDIPVVIHGTDSCGYGMYGEIAGERISDGHTGDLGDAENLFCTGMGGLGTVFGGRERLEELLEELAGTHPFVLVVTTCLADMVGEDVEGVAGKVMSRHPGTRIHVIGGNRPEQGADAHMEVLKAFCSLIDVNVEPSLPLLSVADDSFITYNRGHNRSALGEIASALGLRPGPELVNGCSLDDLVNAGRAKVIAMCEDTPSNRELKDILLSKGLKVRHRCVPRGFRETVEWLEHMKKMDPSLGDPGRCIASLTSEYGRAVSECSHALTGKKIVLVTDGSEPVYWIEEALCDCGADATVVEVGRNRTDHRLPSTHTDTIGGLTAAVGQDTVVIGKRYLTDVLDRTCMDFPDTFVGGTASVLFLRRLKNFASSGEHEGWKEWGRVL
ncbi:MAG: AAA family ATPase [archaeon]|nr:AAA family ATPase [archaeon]